MFCMECGKPLPEGAKFCAFCGKPQPQLSVPVSGSEGTPAEPASSGTVPFAGSEKNGSMIYVPGNGIYINYLGRTLCFLPEGGKKLKKLTRNRGNYQYYNMDYCNGTLYIWQTNEGIRKLIALDVNSQSRRAVDLPKNSSPVLTGSRFMIQNGIGYCLGFGNTVMSIDLRSETVQEKKLPDISSKPLPESWIKENRFNSVSKSYNYGESYSFLYISGEYGYASFLSSEYTAVRFRLDDPGRFDFVPADYCTVPTTHGGLISGCGPWLIGSGRLANTIHICKIEQDGSMSSDKSVSLQNTMVDSNGLKGWWRAGSCYVFDNILLDVDEMKCRKLPFHIRAEDFAPAGGGGVYLYDGSLLYRLPPDFETSVSHDQLSRYVIADVGKFCD